MLMFSNADCQVLLSRRTEPMPFFVRYIDGDLLSFVHKGCGLLETEFGPLRYREGDWVYIPKACTFRQVPDSGEDGASTLLMIQAHRRVPGATSWSAGAGIFPFDPSQAVIPDPDPIAEERPRRVRGPAHPQPNRGSGNDEALSTNTIRSTWRGVARRQLRVHLQHRRLQRGDLRQCAPAADRALVHARPPVST